MGLKLTLITAPDIYQNNNHSILLLNINETEQEESSQWFGKSSIDLSLNLYYYSNDNNIDWLLFASASSDYTYINLDNTLDTSNLLLGYFIGNSKCFYTTKNTSVLEVYKKINHNYVNSISNFLKSILRED